MAGESGQIGQANAATANGLLEQIPVHFDRQHEQGLEYIQDDQGR
jgi:hypothetical protein